MPTRAPGLTVLLVLATGCVDKASETTNRPPVLQTLVPRSLAEGEALQFFVGATDPDGDGLTFNSTRLPTGATLDRLTGEFNWTPGFDQAGDYPIPLQVTDDGSPPATAHGRLILIVTQVNRPPTIDQPEGIDGWTGSKITVRLKPDDADGDAVTVQCEDTPEGLRIHPETGLLEWEPACGQSGVYALLCTVRDDGDPRLITEFELVLSIAPRDEVCRASEGEGEGEGEGEAPREGEGEGAFEGEGEGPAEGEGEGPAQQCHGPGGRPLLPPDDPQPACGDGPYIIPPLEGGGQNFHDEATPECEQLCADGQECGMVGEDGWYASNERNCLLSCGEASPGEQACLAEQVGGGNCDLSILAQCAQGPGEGEGEGPPGEGEGELPPGEGEGEPGGAYGGGQDGFPLALILEQVGGDPAGAPVAPRVEVYPKSGRFQGPFGLRFCVVEENGLSDLDADSASLVVDGDEMADQLVWTRNEQNRVCGQIEAEGGPEGWPGWRVIDIPAEVSASISDTSGLVGRDTARYEALDIPDVRFSDRSEAAGFGDFFPHGNTHSLGAAWIDLNDDDLPDLYVTNGQGRSNGLFLNRGDGTFEDVTGRTPLRLRDHEGSAVIFADIDNDGDDDLYIMNSHPSFELPQNGGDFDSNSAPGHANALFENHSGQCFTEITEDAGLLDINAQGAAYRSVTGAFADYDLDGCIDLFVIHRRYGEADPDWDDDKLYRNNCDGTFDDVTVAAGVDDFARDGQGVLFEDLDGDLFPELYIVNTDDRVDPGGPPLFGENRPVMGQDDVLLHNNTDGTFTDITRQAGVGTHTIAGMGIVAGDFDQDGDFDLHITDISEPLGQGSALYRNLLVETGELQFREDSFVVGDRPASGDFGWGNIFADFNNDGHLDLAWVGPDNRWLMMGNGAGDLSALLGPRRGEEDAEAIGMPDVIQGRGMAAADYDRDGRVDLLIMQDNLEDRRVATPLLLRNVTPAQGQHWIELRLRATVSNRTAIGTRVEVYPEGLGGRMLLRQISGGHSVFSQSERILHFGLGATRRVERIVIKWPAGGEQHVCNVGADQLLTVVEIPP